MQEAQYFITPDKSLFLSIGVVNAVLYNFDKKRLFHITKKLAEDVLKNDSVKLPDQIKECLPKDFLFKRLKKDNFTIKPYFRRVFLDLTDCCNFKCQDCFHAGNMNGRFLDDAVLKKLMGLPTDKYTTLAILGGEPLIYPREKFITLINQLKSKFSYIDLYTNASLLDEKLAIFLKENDISIRLTFYSTILRKHDEYTQIPGSYKKLKEKIKMLQKIDAKYSISLILEAKGMVSYKRKKTGYFYHQFKKNKIQHLEIRRPSVQNRDKSIALIQDRKKLYGEKYKPVKLGSFSDALKNIHCHSCYAGLISIDTQGNLYNCPMVRDECLGNLCDHHFGKSDIRDKLFWNQPVWLRYEQCKSCEFNFLCHDCPYMTKTISELKGIKHIDKPYFCQYSPTKGIYGDD